MSSLCIRLAREDNRHDGRNLMVTTPEEPLVYNLTDLEAATQILD